MKRSFGFPASFLLAELLLAAAAGRGGMKDLETEDGGTKGFAAPEDGGTNRLKLEFMIS